MWGWGYAGHPLRKAPTHEEEGKTAGDENGWGSLPRRLPRRQPRVVARKPVGVLVHAGDEESNGNDEEKLDAWETWR
jgi:hypothetical protein